MPTQRLRLGVVVSHPIQYQVPLFRYLESSSSVEPVVFFLAEHGLHESYDAGFGRLVKYDVPLLGGYEHRLVRNRSPRPNVSKPFGLVNPALPRIIIHSDIDVLLVHGYSALSHWLAYATAAAFRVPYVLRGESHPDHDQLTRPRRWIKRAMLKPLVKNASACLAIGVRNAQFYQSYGAGQNQIFFSPYSIDTERFSAAGAVGRSRRSRMLQSIDLKPDLPLVLFAGKLRSHKRPSDLVGAMDRLHCNANLVMIGDGPLRAELEHLSSSRPWMRMLGFVNQSEIAKWYGAADLFVLPSEVEPWGLAVNEAMAAGAVPIVSDSVGCAPDLVIPDVGWVYPTGDSGSLAKVIAEGCQPGALDGRRRAAQQRAVEYGIRATARGIEAAVAATQTRRSR